MRLAGGSSAPECKLATRCWLNIHVGTCVVKENVMVTLQAAAVQSGDDEGKALLPPMAAVPDAEMADAPAAEDRANPVVSMEEDGRKHKKEKREKKEKKEKKEKSEKKHKHKDKRKDREEPGGEAAVEEADEKRAFEENLRRKALEQTTRS